MGLWQLFPKLHDEGWETLNYEIKEGSRRASVILGSCILSYSYELSLVMVYHRLPCDSSASCFQCVLIHSLRRQELTCE